ncbi:MAG: hypothetical protein BroJett003_27950 [Planctomycetota bacterium]|nr:MAG: hypothetical protein BroJett003_27950 [Planctomycetota bacterium]
MMRRSKGLACVGIGLVGLGLSAGTSCRDEPPPPAYAEDLGEGGRILPPMPPTQYSLPEKLVSGRAALKTIDFERIGNAAGPAPPGMPSADDAGAADAGAVEAGGEATDVAATPAAVPAPTVVTTADFPETAQGVQALMTSFNEVAAQGDPMKLVDFFTEDQRPDMTEAYRIAVSVVDRAERLMKAVEKQNPQAAQMMRAGMPGLGKRDQMFIAHLATLTPESETKATGKLGGAFAGKTVTFRKVDDGWYIDPNAAKLLEEFRKEAEKIKPLDAISEGLENGSLDLATAQQRLLEWMASLKPSGAEATPATSEAPPAPEGGNP